MESKPQVVPPISPVSDFSLAANPTSISVTVGIARPVFSANDAGESTSDLQVEWTHTLVMSPMALKALAVIATRAVQEYENALGKLPEPQMGEARVTQGGLAAEGAKRAAVPPTA